MVMCVSEGEREKGEVWTTRDFFDLLKKIDGKELALERWRNRVSELEREVKDLQTIHNIYAGALMAQQGKSVKVGVTVWVREDLERELEKVRVILRGKEKALGEWKRRVERMEKELNQLKKKWERLGKGRVIIEGKEMK